ncbi:hypothetical protein FGO68_gene16262 [Halteria grandinella]|uniref:Uncharacterized protein n=1 Tax=Halteria grandinella TaxID=5974 RepID=A0A8J8NGX0_HALGN|nr:hypothetical protein FGO68_gene16262 [Halteria grandinella]
MKNFQLIVFKLNLSKAKNPGIPQRSFDFNQMYAYSKFFDSMSCSIYFPFRCFSTYTKKIKKKNTFQIFQI